MAKRSNRVKVGNVEIEVSDLIDQMINQVRTGADGEILKEMEEYQAHLMETASATWPVGRIEKPAPVNHADPENIAHTRSTYSNKKQLWIKLV